MKQLPARQTGVQTALKWNGLNCSINTVKANTQGSDMRSIVIHGAKDLRIESAEPEELAADGVRIRLATGGICGSDLHYYNHGGFGQVRLREPMILGHEVAGYVEQLGAHVDELTEGDLVAVSPSRPCAQCDYCQKGLHNHCLNMRFYGSAMPFPHIQGAFRQDLVVNAKQCVSAEGLSAGEAAMAEPLAVALHAINRAGPLLGKSVLITGCGPIGLLTAMAARVAGAARIVITDISDQALHHATAAGFTETINTATKRDNFQLLTSGKGTMDCVIECSGAPAAVDDAMRAARPRAVMVQLGLGGDMPIPLLQLTSKELDLRGSFRFHEEFAIAIALMKQGRIDVKPLISHTLTLAQAVDAFELASDRSAAMKVQIEF